MMKTFQYLFLCEQFDPENRTMESNSKFEPHVIKGLSERLSAVFRLFESKLMCETKYHFILPQVWVDLDHEEATTDLERVRCINPEFEVDPDATGLSDDEEAQECLYLYNENISVLGEKLSVDANIRIWKGIAGKPNEWSLQFGNLKYYVQQDNDTVLISKNFYDGYSPTFDDLYLQVLFEVTGLLVAQYKKMELLGYDGYYDSLKIDPNYRNAWMYYDEYLIAKGEEHVTSLTTEEKDFFLTNYQQLAREPYEGIAMTRSLYVKAVHMALCSVHDSAKEMSPEEAYDRFADSRHEGLTELENTNEAFLEWMNRKHRDTSYAEIIPAMSKSLAVFIFVEQCRDGGQCLRIHAGPNSGSYESAIKFALALQDEYPVSLDYGEAFTARLTGKSIVLFTAFGYRTVARYADKPRALSDAIIECIDYEHTPRQAIEKGWPVHQFELSE
ncbi:hypothetical protein LRP52_48050 [Photobacterium sp. ZSDE20]|uniref:Uncharacterized protein n=1 Tax=Photobacterium pectinilyticum TaxID=2906793 RepID=A0ABT1N982_9GAMM|nr:hypothetical protein [Photobacterium sp. ZSDE20]MCQ1061310.1 hypothetical protein [Photobacterium sp. ZSDE20]MDD1829896.1 hypothetical protein [Photobacterium sp. ZSDE20]